ncbi:hypothetical protein ACOMHN_046041 [Nucella lapillus]
MDPVLHDIVIKHMVHRPCGPCLDHASPCLDNGECKKFRAETRTDCDGYPLYRRRKPADGGQTAKILIVPYSSILSKIFNAHINVESCNSVKFIKYVCKYINKGSDQAVFTLENGLRNEVAEYLTDRYISTTEAVWRILRFPIHKRQPTVERLAIHLENGQQVVFNETNLADRAENSPQTTLTEFFQLYEEDPFAKTLLYVEIPLYYTWSQKKWIRRKRGKVVPPHAGIFKGDALGRVYRIDIRNKECYCVRLLLHTKRGPTSFTDLRTVNCKECDTFQQACLLLGLLEDDSYWDDTLTEASLSSSPGQLRHLFAIMIAVCGLSDPANLWVKHKEEFCEDLLRDIQRHNPDQDIPFNQEIFNSGLLLLEDKVVSLGGRELQFYQLPEPRQHERVRLARHMLREMNYDQEDMADFVATHEPTLVEDQLIAYNAVLGALEQGQFFFLDAPGGTGKTFLINLLLSKVWQRGDITIAVASSGIAATLLTGGRTAHSTFKLPLNLAQHETPSCNIHKNTDEANVLKQAKLIVWDDGT